MGCGPRSAAIASNAPSCAWTSTRSTGTHRSAAVSASDVFVTGRRAPFGAEYDIELDGREFERKPGVWDPLIGVGWHHHGRRQARIARQLRRRWLRRRLRRDISHRRFGRLEADHALRHHGRLYLLYFKLSNTVADRTFTAKQTMHGPIVGIGLYF